jgi:glycosyltransferase involved in cell wall biosynthesis
MKIWIENPFDNLPVEGYRPQRYWLMARAFAQAGHEVVYWTSGFSHSAKAPRVITCGKAEGDDFELVFIPAAPYRKNVCPARIFNHWQYARRWLEKARARARSDGAPDVLIVSMPPLSTADAALKLKKEFGCRLIVDIMDAWPDTFRRLFPKFLRPLAPAALLPMYMSARRLYRAADRITGVCDAYGKLARRSSRADYFRAYHGIAVPEADRAFRHGGGRRLVYIGNLGKGYDLGTVIDAVREMPEFSLDIAGSGDMESVWRERAAGVENIRFHGYLPREKLETLLKSAAIGVIPLSDETCVGVPYKLGDYALAGLSMVTSLGGECAELLDRHGAGICYHDKESLKKAILAAGVLKPDFSALLKELDAAVIYPAYVRFATNGL